MARIAFVGLGNMGVGMATRLIQTGHQLSVYNRTASRAQALVRQGAQLFDSPKGACQGVDAVISMLADDSASRAVWLGRDGILAAGNFAKNGFAIECSTLSHAWVVELSSLCRARGLRYLDAPVTGLPDGAAAGSLTLLVGADTDDLWPATESFVHSRRAHDVQFSAPTGSPASKSPSCRTPRRLRHAHFAQLVR